ncbi:MAG: TIGR04133 family radical SAM/SPASM protein [Tannerellaceae bacterium]|nr:TIGR04133 family radical SAM/SPASM protein [Tannerellaceae bacterium]
MELFQKIKKNKVQLHELRTLFWECTLRCNISCLHCGSDCRVVTNQPDMPVKDFLQVIDSITPHVNPNHLLIIFTGGEALVRRDLKTCGLELYRRGYPWGIVTNGLQLTRQRLDSLLASGLHSITVSLDGFKEAHNWLRGHPRSFDQAVEAIRMLIREEEIVWDIVTCVNKHNLSYLQEFKEFLIRTGVKRWRIFTIFPVGRAANYSEFQLSGKEFTSVFEFIRQTRQEGRIRLSYSCEGFLGNYETEVRDQMFQCHAGVSVGSVLADGSISGCPSIRANFHQGNIYKDDFMDIWENKFIPYRDRSWTRKGTCADCKMFRYCEGNGMHLYDNEENLLFCHYKRLI